MVVEFKRHEYFPLYDVEESLVEREAMALFRAETSIEQLYQNHSPDVFHAIVSRYNEKYDD